MRARVEGGEARRGRGPAAGVLALVVAATIISGACKRPAADGQRRPRRVEDRFARAMISRIGKVFPRARFTVKEPLLLDVAWEDGEGTSTLSLDSLFRDCHGEVEGCESAERFPQGLAQTHHAEDGGDPTTVRPVLKDARWMASVEEKHKEAPADEQAGNRLVTAPFVADLVIVYAFDSPDAMRMMSERDRAKLGLEPAAIDALARKNLRAAFPGALPDEEIEPGIHEIHADDSYEASRLLLDAPWKAPAGAVKGDLLVAAPTCDFVLYTGSRERPEVLNRFRTLVGEYEATRGHPISTTILRRTSAGWRAWR